GGNPPQTEAEKRAAVNQQIDRSLEAFDARIAREQVALQSDREAAAAAASTVGGGGGAGGDGGLPGGNGPPGGPPPGIGGEEVAGDEPPGGTASGRQSRGNRPDLPTPADIPDGRDDDVVARQLREAAERETDLPLREKLWKEYRDYKKRQ
ncbi:hypothetical protein, partial [Nevskia sp.]|uniref:hypothetical protein n=1 Tax=Nevskia sp. TaxID=1929292 RepID=UPI0025FEC733